METYSFLREFADSWMLLAMFLFFIGVVIWVYLPSRAKSISEAASIPFRTYDLENGTSPKKRCTGDCDGCKKTLQFLENV